MGSDAAFLHDGDYVTVDVCSISCRAEEVYSNLAMLKAYTIEARDCFARLGTWVDDQSQADCAHAGPQSTAGQM